MRLSEHFTLEELTHSQTAVRKGLDNTPDHTAIENLRRLCETLELVRKAVKRPVHISSGYRSPEVNEAVGGIATSHHCKGLAADITVPGLTTRELCNVILKENINFQQLINEYDAWVHISVPPIGQGPKNETLTYQRGRPVVRGII